MAKSARASSENLFSISAASDALKRSRRTITKALTNVRPSSTRHGLKLWKMADIIEAVNRNTMAPVLLASSASVNGDLQDMFDGHALAEERMRALPTLEARRKAARAMIPPIVEMDKATRQAGIANGQDSDFVHLRCDAMLRLCARGIEGPTEWSHDQVWEMLCLEQGKDEGEAA
jgi:hypothetical protein